MSEMIDRQAAIDAVHRTIFDFFDICSDDDESPMTYKDMQLLELNKAIMTKIRKLPFVDAVEVVRCKDCVHYDTHYIWSCALNAVKVGEDDFCSRGRKENQ